MILNLLSKLLKASMFVLAFCIVWWSSLVSADQTEATSTVEVYMALANEHDIPLRDAKNSFECTEKIFSVVELANYETGKHMLSVLWVDPEGNERERTEYPFYVRNESTRLWSWLQLSRATGAGMLQWINPAAGLEEFIGEWTVDILIDGKKKASTSFDVLC